MVAFLKKLFPSLFTLQTWLKRKLAQPTASGQKRLRRSPLLLGCVLLLCSGLLGWGMVHASTPPPIGTVDPVPQNLRVGQQIYLQRCGSCHIGVPPAVLPSQTWVRLLQTPEHYVTRIEPLLEPDLTLAWGYLRTFSRPVPRREPFPFRLRDSRFFKALHPRVDLPQPVTINTCATCHINAARYDFRSLAPEWENAP